MYVETLNACCILGKTGSLPWLSNRSYPDSSTTLLWNGKQTYPKLWHYPWWSIHSHRHLVKIQWKLKSRFCSGDSNGYKSNEWTLLSFNFVQLNLTSVLCVLSKAKELNKKFSHGLKGLLKAHVKEFCSEPSLVVDAIIVHLIPLRKSAKGRLNWAFTL